MIFKNLKFFFNISLIVPTFVFILDRITKIYVINLSKNSFDIELYTSKFLNITLIWNEGIAFGLFSASHEYWYNFLTIVISFVAFIILIDTLKAPIINVFPGIEIILFNLFETLQDIKLFIIDLS